MTHTYKKGKLIFPSVTTIIGDSSSKQALVQWSANATRDFIVEHFEQMQGMGIDNCLNAARFDYRRLSREALDIGSEVHALIERDLIYDSQQLIFSNHPETMKCYEAWLKFWAAHELKAEKVEFTVYGDCWAGTMDFKGYLDGVPTLLDWKTSKKIYMDSMGPQIASYWAADNRWAERAGILRLDKVSGEYEIKILKPKRLEKYYREFGFMLELYMERHPIISRRAGK